VIHENYKIFNKVARLAVIGLATLLCQEAVMAMEKEVLIQIGFAPKELTIQTDLTPQEKATAQKMWFINETSILPTELVHKICFDIYKLSGTIFSCPTAKELELGANTKGEIEINGTPFKTHLSLDYYCLKNLTFKYISFEFCKHTSAGETRSIYELPDFLNRVVCHYHSNVIRFSRQEWLNNVELELDFGRLGFGPSMLCIPPEMLALKRGLGHGIVTVNPVEFPIKMSKEALFFDNTSPPL
jgi:hypothetical protein